MNKQASSKKKGTSGTRETKQNKKRKHTHRTTTTTTRREAGHREARQTHSNQAQEANWTERKPTTTAISAL